jgi:hypothetical protein
MTVTTDDAISANERAPNSSLRRAALALLMACAQHLGWLRRKLKQAITFAYASRVIGAGTAQRAQRFVDRYELWSD